MFDHGFWVCRQVVLEIHQNHLSQVMEMRMARRMAERMERR